MRIIAGRLRRKTLKAPKGNLTRPTSDRTREAIFSMLEARMNVQGTRVLDLFAGTGALGLEAISRGADTVTFVETSGPVLRVARQNAEDLGVSDVCWFLRADANTYMQRYRGAAWDVVFADPPYALAQLTDLPALVLPHLNRGGWFVLEHDKRHDFGRHPHLDTARAYGRTTVSLFYVPESQDESEEDATIESKE